MVERMDHVSYGGKANLGGVDVVPVWLLTVALAPLWLLPLQVEAQEAAVSQNPAILQDSHMQKLSPLERNLPRLNTVISLTLEDVPIIEALRSISEAGGLKLVYGDNKIVADEHITAAFSETTVLQAIHEILRDKPLALKITAGGQLILTEREIPVIHITEPQPAPLMAPGSITGRVFDQVTNETLPGVNVVIVGTTQGAATDADGRYLIEDVEPGVYRLQASIIGYQSQIVSDVSVSDNQPTEVNFTLREDVAGLEEVVVIGYGTVQRADLTGSIASVKGEDISILPTTSLLHALAGRAPGVQVIQSTGAPGTGPSVRIRGSNSIQGGNEPLYVIDGFPLSGSPTHLNTTDIQSMEILKDASATAIYGSRGANGVVVITTKQGAAGRTRVDFESSYGVQSLRKKLELMNAQEYAQLMNLQAKNDKLQPYFTEDQIASFGEGFDWQDFIFRQAPMLTSALNISGGNTNTRFSVSGSVAAQEGIIPGSDYNRYALRTNFDHTISSKFSVNLASTFSNLQTERKDNGGGQRGNSMINAALSASPLSEPYNPDGTYTVLSQAFPFVAVDLRNPLNQINEQFAEIKANVLLANAALVYKPIPEVAIKVSGGMENRDDRNDSYTTRQYINSSGNASVSTSNSRSLLSENTISYNDTFSERHKISAVAGFTYQEFLTTFLSGSGSGFLSDAFRTYDLNAAATPGIPGSGYARSVILSYLGRVNYNFNDRYLITASIRADGSSRYSPGNKWGYFPSGAFAWRVSEEAFFPENKWIGDLKLRTSWGLTGSQAISPYTTLNQLSSGNTVFGDELYTAFSPSTRLPGTLKWETTEQIDFGMDAALLNERIFLTLDYYVKNTRDLLNTVRLPTSTGFSTTIQNVGKVRNRGFELGINADLISTKDFMWDVETNVGINRNKVVNLYNGEDILTGSVNVLVMQDNVGILREGRPIGQFWGYEVDGYTDAGQFKYKDLNGDGTVDANDKTYIGNPNPDFIYGFGSAASYKNFELSVFVQGVYGNDIFNVSSVASTIDYGQGLNMPREVFLDNWSPENTDARFPIVSRRTTTNPSDRWVEDGSFLRLKNIQLAYSVPVHLMKANWMRNLQVYVSGQNLLTLTNYSWWDPEISSRGGGIDLGIDHYSYPVAKSITFGIRAGL